MSAIAAAVAGAVGGAVANVVSQATGVAIGPPRMWSHGLFDCCQDCNLCMKGCFCPCCLYGENVEKFDASSCFCNCVLWLSLGGYTTPIEAACRRGAMRARYYIQGSEFEDFCVHLFCFPCAIIQESQEIRHVFMDVSKQAYANFGQSQINTRMGGPSMMF